MTVLLDANLLIALLVADHVHHDAAESWLSGSGQQFATCPITQGSLVRLVKAVSADPRHEFWPDDIGYEDVTMTGIIGHRQVTDAYLAQLARVRRGRLATFDQGLAALHQDVADLVPTG